MDVAAQPQAHEDLTDQNTNKIQAEPHKATANTSARVVAVVPCFNRPDDAKQLLQDLTASDHPDSTNPTIRLTVLIVDNASTTPLSDIPAPDALTVHHLRLPTNTGGSGGYNAGMRQALKLLPPSPPSPTSPDHANTEDYIWLVDSDARVRPDTLAGLVRALQSRPDAAAVGPALGDPDDKEWGVFEIGGILERHSGRFKPAVDEFGNTPSGTPAPPNHLPRGFQLLSPGRPKPLPPPQDPVDAQKSPTTCAVHPSDSPPRVFDCDYAAACCLLVRAKAVQAAGLFPDTFLNADDVAWGLRLNRFFGPVLATPDVLAAHPPFWRFATWARYYVCRNALGPIDELDLGPAVRFRRWAREAVRAAQQELMGRDDLAGLHLSAMRDALAGRLVGPAAAGRIAVRPLRPYAELGEVLTKLGRSANAAKVRMRVHPLFEEDTPKLVPPIMAGLSSAGLEVEPGTSGESGVLGRRLSWIGRLVGIGIADAAVVPPRGRPTMWFAGRVTVQADAGGFVVRTDTLLSRLGLVRRSLTTLTRGLWCAARAAMRPPGYFSAPYEPASDVPAVPGALSAVVVSYNRVEAVLRTVGALVNDPAVHEVIVVDNASSDGTPEIVAKKFPGVRVLALQENTLIDAFNRGVSHATGEYVVVLDDDATPRPGVLERAKSLLDTRPDLGAVTLHPIHPKTGRSEWPFAELARASTSIGVENIHDRWPVMGCGNVVRRSDWLAAGGYERRFGLYRNDTDLALKLAAAGRGVHFDPDLIVDHDSPAAHKKSARWHQLATRNWIWTCRRHGANPVERIIAGLVGWAWSHKLAGVSPRRQWSTLLGGCAGLLRRPAVVRWRGQDVGGQGGGLKRLLDLRRREHRSRGR